MNRSFLHWGCLGLCLLLANEVAAQNAKHVVVVGVDGMGAEGLQRVMPPNLKALMQRGAWTLKARAVIPTVSSPNWASMVMGAGPPQHGITSNEWQPDKFDIAPICKGKGDIFPTIYGVLREQKSNALIGIFHDWDGYGRLFERQAVNEIVDAKSSDEAVARAVAFFKRKPTLTFIHFDHVDHAGHDHGWLSAEYDAALNEADRLIGEVIRGLKDAGIFDDTILLVTADHGGKETKHGGNTMSEIEIPWLIAGKGIAVGKEIVAPVNTYDTAATLAHLFGLRRPECWIAKPVLSAFRS